MNIAVTPRGPVAQCVDACKVTIAHMQQEHTDALKTIFINYYNDLDRLGGREVVKALTRKDALAAMKATNRMLETPAMVDTLTKMIKDLAKHYKKNTRHIDAIIRCYLTHCDKEAIDLIYEIIRMSFNMMRLATNPKVHKELQTLQSMLRSNVEYAMKLLSSKRKST